ncbi:hypothetical protein CBR_g23040 [Chara braunii]|uniref:Uncharacterized protein n=1 Tax=Chara braunii TaxID=69332 RepID=A0A388L3E0_CHABU|nr:hypothetical protein CBR_g23040 [Chara braunii]|eukprot:GBG76824.1 hypothetical protein CBR_g23040 [Chara braunii]
MRYKPCLMLDHQNNGYAAIEVICADTPWCENCRRYFHKSKDCPSKHQTDSAAANGSNGDLPRNKNQQADKAEKRKAPEGKDKGRKTQGDPRQQEKEKGRVQDREARNKPPHPNPSHEQGGGRVVVVWKKKDPNPSERSDEIRTPLEKGNSGLNSDGKDKGAKHIEKAELHERKKAPSGDHPQGKGDKDVEMISEDENRNEIKERVTEGETEDGKGNEDLEETEDSEEEDGKSEEEEEEETEEEDDEDKEFVDEEEEEEEDSEDEEKEEESEKEKNNEEGEEEKEDDEDTKEADKEGGKKKGTRDVEWDEGAESGKGSVARGEERWEEGEMEKVHERKDGGSPTVEKVGREVSKEEAQKGQVKERRADEAGLLKESLEAISPPPMRPELQPLGNFTVYNNNSFISEDIDQPDRPKFEMDKDVQENSWKLADIFPFQKVGNQQLLRELGLTQVNGFSPAKKTKRNDATAGRASGEESGSPPRDQRLEKDKEGRKRPRSLSQSRRELSLAGPMKTITKADKTKGPIKQFLIPLIISESAVGLVLLTRITSEDGLEISAIPVIAAPSNEEAVELAKRHVMNQTGSVAVLPSFKMNRYLSQKHQLPPVVFHMALMGIRTICDNFEKWCELEVHWIPLRDFLTGNTDSIEKLQMPVERSGGVLLEWLRYTNGIEKL